jgi:hypothetical protein
MKNIIKDNKNYTIEVTRNNVTPGEFLAYIRTILKNKGINRNCSTYTNYKPKELASGSELSTNYYVDKNDKKHNISRDGTVSIWPKDNDIIESVIYRDEPYDKQTFTLNFDGSCYNEIIEFNFSDDKVGYGYYFLHNKEA